MGRALAGERGATDAVRAHWFALPLLRGLAGEGAEGLVEVRLDEGEFHVWLGAEEGPAYGDGPAPEEPDVRLSLDTGTCTDVSRGISTLSDAVREGRIEVTGESTLAKVLRGE